MPKKIHLTVDDFLEAAVGMVEEDGWQTLSITALAKDLGCSTMPVYSHFENLDSLKDQVVKKGWDLVKKYESKRYTGDVWIDPAIGYVFFARENNRLFAAMLDGRNPALERQMMQVHWDDLTRRLEGYSRFEPLSPKLCRVIRYSRAMLTQGVATSVSKGIGKLLTDDETIKTYLTVSSLAILDGYRNTWGNAGPDLNFMDENFQPVKGYNPRVF